MHGIGFKWPQTRPCAGQHSHVLLKTLHEEVPGLIMTPILQMRTLNAQQGQATCLQPHSRKEGEAILPPVQASGEADGVAPRV